MTLGACGGRVLVGTLEEIEKVLKNDWPPYKNLLSNLCLLLNVLTIYLIQFFWHDVKK